MQTKCEGSLYMYVAVPGYHGSPSLLSIVKMIEITLGSIGTRDLD